MELRQKEAFLLDAGKNVIAAFERSLDERVHPTWNVLGTATGRITCTEPSLISVPRHARQHFIPGPGNVFVHGDYAAAQLRILAELVREEALMEVFVENEDPHLATAMLMTDLSAVDAEPHRDRAKALSFGLPFGMTPKGLVRSASRLLKFEAHAGDRQIPFAVI